MKMNMLAALMCLVSANAGSPAVVGEWRWLDALAPFVSRLEGGCLWQMLWASHAGSPPVLAGKAEREMKRNLGSTAPLTPLLAAWYVAPEGDDAGPGTEQQPFATPGRAQAAARAFLANLPSESRGAVKVRIVPGTYYLSETLVFTAADSGSQAVTVVWQAWEEERPVFSGGSPVGTAGWKRDQGDVWVTEVPEAGNRRWVFRDLYYHAQGKQVVFPLGGGLASWQERGYDTDSIVADPLFADPAAGDFTLGDDSPALALGFEPFDYTAAGPDPDAPTAVPVVLPPLTGAQSRR